MCVAHYSCTSKKERSVPVAKVPIKLPESIIWHTAIHAPKHLESTAVLEPAAALRVPASMAKCRMFYTAPGLASTFPSSFLGTKYDICFPKSPFYASFIPVWYSTSPNELHPQTLPTHHLQVWVPPSLSPHPLPILIWPTAHLPRHLLLHSPPVSASRFDLPGLFIQPLWGLTLSWEATMYHQKGKTVFSKACQLSQDSQAMDTCLLSEPAASCLVQWTTSVQRSAGFI